MKPVIFLFLLNLLYTAAISADATTHHDHQHEHDRGITVNELSAGSVDPNGEQINVNVFGLVCDFCAQAIEKVFMKRAEVSGIKVDLAGGLVSIYTKQGAELPDATLTRLIVDAGYNVDSINRK